MYYPVHGKDFRAALGLPKKLESSWGEYNNFFKMHNTKFTYITYSAWVENLKHTEKIISEKLHYITGSLGGFGTLLIVLIQAK